MGERIVGFDPIIFEDSQFLILGTLPGRKSLEQKMYYSDKGNYFWKFLSRYSDKDFPTTTQEKLQLLESNKIALWDIYEFAIRENKKNKNTSNDSDIREASLNDIEMFVKQHTSLRKIGVVGKKAYSDFVRYFPRITACRLPSTSGSNGAQWGNKNITDIIDMKKTGWMEWTAFLENEG